MKGKYLLILLALIPNVLFAQNYKYSHIHVTETGSDYFTNDQVKTQQNVGEITFSGDIMRIDHVKYHLKPMKNENWFRSGRDIVRLVYSQHTLASVQLYKYNQVYHYEIENGADISMR
ncbi:MAG TPA: hypothetical protein VN721_15370 [Flavipsychrobacter sp.]|nr:hypothetical protein [Flavipsychrobacter sp.]